MTRHPPRDVATSVHARLRNLARARRQDLNAVLVLYGLERLLARLSRSRHREGFLLKGALLFVVWGDAGRPTRDLDLLSSASPDVDGLEATFREICREAPPEPDGLVLDPDSVRGEAIREGALYHGVRLMMRATLGRARIAIQVDVGFGDAVTPPPEEVRFPTLLGHAEPTLRAYRRETVVAESWRRCSRWGSPTAA